MMNEYKFTGRYGDAIEEYTLIWDDGDTYASIYDSDDEFIVRVGIIVGLPADKMLEAIVDAYWNGFDNGQVFGQLDTQKKVFQALGL